MGFTRKGSIRRHAAAPAARHARRSTLYRHRYGHEDGRGLEEGWNPEPSAAAHLEHHEIATFHRRIAVPHALALPRQQLALLLLLLGGARLRLLRRRRLGLAVGRRHHYRSVLSVRQRRHEHERVLTNLRRLEAEARHRGGPRAVQARQYIFPKCQPPDRVGRTQGPPADLDAVHDVLEDLPVVVEVERRGSVDVRCFVTTSSVPLRVPRDLDDLARPVVAQLKGNIYLVDHHPAEHAYHAEELLIILQSASLDATGVGELHVIRIDVP